MDEVKAVVADAYRPVIARPRRGAVECARLAGERRGVAFAPPCPSPFFGRAEADAINAFAVVEAGHADAAAAAFEGRRQFDVDKGIALCRPVEDQLMDATAPGARSEERRVGNDGVSKGRSRGATEQ